MDGGKGFCLVVKDQFNLSILYNPGQSKSTLELIKRPGIIFLRGAAQKKGAIRTKSLNKTPYLVKVISHPVNKLWMHFLHKPS
jgi:hypothetical protein